MKREELPAILFVPAITLGTLTVLASMSDSGDTRRRPLVKGREYFFGGARPPMLSLASSSSSIRTASVSSVLWLRTKRAESRQTAIRIKHQPDRGRRPGGFAAPEERWYRTVSKKMADPWLPTWRRQSPDSLRCVRSAFAAAGDGDPASNSVQLAATPVTVPGSPGSSSVGQAKAARSHRTRLALLQDVIAGARQLVRQRLSGDHVVGLGFLAGVEAVGLGAMAAGEDHRLRQRHRLDICCRLTLPSPFFLRLLWRTLSTRARCRKTKCPTSANRSIRPVSRIMTVRVSSPTPGTLVRRPYCVRGRTRC